MKPNKLIFPSVALATMMAGCDDQIMEWKESDPTVEVSEIPLQLAEQISLYKPIKEYVAQYRPGLNLSLGMGADMYLDDPAYKAIVDENFTGVTLGNAMKMSSIINDKGEYNFSTVDNIMTVLPSDMTLYGHNLLWHTQQAAGWLNTCIAPTIKKAETTPGATMEWVNKVEHGDMETENAEAFRFQGGEAAIAGGASGGYSDGGAGGSSKCFMIHNPAKQANNYDTQLFIVFEPTMTEGEQWRLLMDVKASEACSAVIQAHTEPGSYKHWKFFSDVNFTTDWTAYESVLTVDADMATSGCVAFNLGDNAVDYYFDNIRLERYEAQEAEQWTELLTNGDCEGSDMSSFSSMGAATMSFVGNGKSGNCIMVNNPAVQSADYGSQFFVTFFPKMAEGDVYEFSMDVRSDAPAKFATQAHTSPGNYLYWNLFGDIESTTDWQTVKFSLTASSDLVGAGALAFNLGNTATNYYFDNISFKKQGSEIIIEKTPEEKAEILTEQMETWIKTMVGHCKSRVHEWDVLNEPVGDNLKLRGVDYVPEEKDGDDFYWGEYLGKDYAVMAFKFAREADPEAKLFVNDYNLESSPQKLEKLIEYVKYIDENGGHVDGIGTQMHVNVNISKENVDAMFKTLAATGKLVRITELDVAFGVEAGKTVTPSAEQLIQQGETYRMIISSYFENVPEAQQSAVTIWTLSDNKKEHEYWLTGDAPNIFDSNYQRKVAYKGVCDAIAGSNIADSFSGESWKDLHKTNEEVTE